MRVRQMVSRWNHHRVGNLSTRGTPHPRTNHDRGAFLSKWKELVQHRSNRIQLQDNLPSPRTMGRQRIRKPIQMAHHRTRGRDEVTALKIEWHHDSVLK